LLTAAPTFQVVGSFPIGTALAQFENLQPDVVLLDLESRVDEAMSQAIESGGMVRDSALVILIDDPEFSVANALHAGIRAVIPRSATAEEIVAAIQASVAGLVVLHPDALHSVLSPTPSGVQPEFHPSDQILSPREIEVLRMIAEGLGNKEIASKLGISDHTVKFHVSAIFAKLGASSRTEAVIIGIREGLIMV
jgi:DNA-binding NarL/FixJ family response regulator